MTNLDSPHRFEELRRTIGRKAALRKIYEEIYQKYAELLERCPKDGIPIELGSGGGFVKDIVPDMVTSDVIPYPGLDQVIDATRMPFADSSLRAICMFDVFHHIPDVGAFLGEAQRCLKPGGRVLIVDEYPGWLSTPIYKYLHHEPYDARIKEWRFESKGPLSDANGALTWVVFERDRKLLAERYPRLKLEAYKPHTPLRYWLAGGLKKWALIDQKTFPAATTLDKLLIKFSHRFGSLVDVELVKQG